MSALNEDLCKENSVQWRSWNLSWSLPRIRRQKPASACSTSPLSDRLFLSPLGRQRGMEQRPAGGEHDPQPIHSTRGHWLFLRRIRTPRNLRILGMFRRLAVRVFLEWRSRHPRPKHKTTTNFQTAMEGDPAFRLLTSKRATLNSPLSISSAQF